MSSPSSWPVIDLDGPPEQRGQDHGRAAADRIEQGLELYQRYFSERYHLSWEDALDAAPKYFEAVSRFKPDLAREIEGIAQGSGRSREEIVVLNARTEMLYEVSRVYEREAQGWLPQKELDFGECTAIGVGPPMTREGEVWLGQTWDWIPGAVDTSVILRIKHDDKPDLLTMTEAGMLGKIGFNHAGLGLCFNLLGTSVNRIGVPAHVLARSVMECTTCSEAIKTLADAEPAGASNFMMASTSGDVINLERCPTDFHVQYGTDGLLTHANHFLESPRQARDRVKALKNTNQSTWLRAGRARRLLKHRDTPLEKQDLKDILSDHGDHPESICRHPDPDFPLDLATNSALILDLHSNGLDYTLGPSCRNRFQRVQSRPQQPAATG